MSNKKPTYQDLEKEIIKLKGDIRKFTTKSTIKSLKEKYE